MKRITFGLSILLILVLAITLLSTACSNTSPTTTSAPATTTAKPAQTSAAPTTSAPATTPAAVSTTAAPASSAVIKLKFGSLYTAPHFRAITDAAWIDKIVKESNGRIQIDYYPGATLVSVKDHYFDVVNGVVDISNCEVGAQASGFDIQRAYQTWMWGVPTDTDRIKIFKTWFSKFPEMPAEYNAKILQYTMGMDYRLFSKKPVRTFEDLKGMKVKAMGAYANWIKACGGEGVPVPMSEAYLDLQKGILDGLLSPYESLKSFKLAEVAKYIIELPITSTPNPNRIMNMNTWNKLPADIQKVFENNIDFFTEEEERQINLAGQDGIAFAKTQNVEFITPSQAEMNKIFEPLKAVCLQQAADLDAKKIKGTEMYNALRALIDQNKK